MMNGSRPTPSGRAYFGGKFSTCRFVPTRQVCKLAATRCAGRRPGFTLIELLVVLAIIAILMSLLMDRGAAFIALAAGWYHHLRRLTIESTLDVPGTLTALVTFALLVGGIHGFACGWRNTGKEPANSPAQRPWRLRWSFGVALGIVVLAAAGIAALGLAHQTAWLAAGPPMFSSGKGGWE